MKVGNFCRLVRDQTFMTSRQKGVLGICHVSCGSCFVEAINLLFLFADGGVRDVTELVTFSARHEYMTPKVNIRTVKDIFISKHQITGNYRKVEMSEKSLVRCSICKKYYQKQHLER